MRSRIVVRAAVILAALVVLAAMSPGTSLAASNGRSGRYLVLARNGADYNALRAKALRGGARVIADMPQVGTLVVSAPDSVRRTLAADPRAIGVAPDHLQRVAPVDGRQVSHLPAPGPRSATRSKVTAAGARASGITPDPAFGGDGGPAPAAGTSPWRSPTPAWTSPTPSSCRRSPGSSTSPGPRTRRSARRSSAPPTPTSRRGSAGRRPPTGTGTARGSAATSRQPWTAGGSTASRRGWTWSRSRSRSGAVPPSAPPSS